MPSVLGAWLEKAFTGFETPDITAPVGGGLLSPDQARRFIRVAIDSTVLARDGRIETSNSPKFEVPRMTMASRILRRGVEGERVGDTAAYGGDVKPTTALVELSTVLFKGEMKVSDELFEDNIERGAVADTLATMLAEQVGRDVEEIAIKADLRRNVGADAALGPDLYLLNGQDGIIRSLETGLPAAQYIDQSATADYDELFASMIEALPARYRRNYNRLRFYTTVRHRDGYQKELAARGTNLGDSATTDEMGERALRFRGIPVREVPIMEGTSTINGAPVDYSKFAMLMDPSNMIWGFWRRVRIERFRDPREGVTSYLPTVRFDVKIADPNYGVLSYNVNL